MNKKILLLELFEFITYCLSFKLNMKKPDKYIKNEFNLINSKCLNNKKNLYVKALIYSRKSQRLLQNISTSNTVTIDRFVNDSLKLINDINDINEIKNNTYINNNDLKIKNIIIGENIYLDVKNVKTIEISTNKDNIKIELDKRKKINTLNNDIDMLIQKIKELDTLLNLLNILLFFQKYKVYKNYIIYIYDKKHVNSLRFNIIN